MTEYRTLNPVSMRSMRIGYLMMFLIASVAAVACLVLRDTGEGVIYGTYAAGAIAIVILIFAIVFPRIYFDHYRGDRAAHIADTDKAEFVFHGILLI